MVTWTLLAVVFSFSFSFLLSVPICLPGSDGWLLSALLPAFNEKEEEDGGGGGVVEAFSPLLRPRKRRKVL